MIGAWLGGFKGGMLATALSTVAIQYYLMEPQASFGPLSSANIARLMLFLIEGVVISWAVAGLHSNRLQRREAEDRYRQIVETASEGIWLADAQWRTTFVNKRMAQMLGYEPHEMLGRSIFEFIMDEQSQAEQRKRIQQREVGQRGSFDIQLRRSDGAGVWVHISASPLMDDSGKFVAVLAMATDVNERKRIEAELAAYRKHLEKLVEQRGEELASSYDRLRMSERMATLGTLAAGLGHDMSNLLFPLRVRLDVIESQSLSPELAEHIAAIRTSTEYLQRLSTGLGMLARDPGRQLVSEEEGDSVDLAAWYAQSASLLKNALPQNVTLECSSNLGGLRRIAMPQHHLTQAMFNLIHNAGVAMKERGGSVRIWAEPLADESAIRLYVSDSGPGMSDEVKQRCMEPFFTTKSDAPHSGLGLSLVQLVVQRVGGQISVESEPGRGTTFVLTIPTVSGAPSGSSSKQENAAAAETCDPPQQQQIINNGAA